MTALKQTNSVVSTVSADGLPLSGARGHFKKTYELLNLKALKFSPVNKIYIF